MKIPALGLCLILLFGLSAGTGCDDSNREEDYLAIGDSITTMTFDTLRSALGLAMATEGVAGAIDYCRLNAHDITSVYQNENIESISRAALRVRNPENAADSLEAVIMEALIALKREGKPLSSRVVTHGGKTHYFRPIILQGACISCHGNPETEIRPAVLEQLAVQYPDDDATGFKVGDVRGVWHLVYRE